MDIMMPDISVWDTIREIVKKGLIKNEAINIVTALSDKDHQSRGILKSYIFDFFFKTSRYK